MTVPRMFNAQGQRKYLTITERKAFVAEARRRAPTTMTFCLTLAYTGARISEVLALSASSIDTAARVIVFESLKKRRRGVYRAVPVPQLVFDSLEDVHHLSALRANPASAQSPLWPWGRTNAWNRVKEVMKTIGVPSSVAMPKALRHGFGVAGIQAKVPLNLIQRWMGHSRLDTTAIYADAIGPEELRCAAALWHITE